jgi:signal transduction histidine kinase
MYLDEVIAEVVQSSRVLAAAKGVAVELAAAESSAFTGDEDLLRRLVANLLDNAVRHAPSGTAVRVDLERRDAGYAISVSDRGPGVPRDMREQIFRRFYRGDATAADGGAGLGLALARWIASVHGGDVTLADSSAAGTTFTAELPDLSR